MIARFFGIKPKVYGDLGELLAKFPSGQIGAPANVVPAR